jgi:hypothetical protein
VLQNRPALPPFAAELGRGADCQVDAECWEHPWMVLYPTEHRNDNNIGSMYHSSATSRTTSSRLRNRVVIIARRADRAAVICCCWVARRAVTCMRPLSSQHSIVGSPSQSCMMRCTALHDSSAHRMSRRRAQGGCEGESPARKATGSTTYCTWGGAGARRLGARSLHSAPGSSPTCDASPKKHHTRRFRRV